MSIAIDSSTSSPAGIAARADGSPEPPRGAAPLLRVTEVTRHFRTKRQDTVALDRVSLEVHGGEVVCLVGPSGCGKSTLLNLVAGFERPDSGRIEFDGAPVTQAGPDRTVVFQEPALFPWLNVRSNVEFGLKLRGVGKAERRERVSELLELVNLSRFERAFIHELSGGMKQRAQLARALAVQPRMLLMDEPFTALDAQTRDVLQLELQHVAKRIGATVLFVTHNVREAAILGDRVVVMTPGPGRIRQDIRVDLPRPRLPDDHGIADLASEIRAYLGPADEPVIETLSSGGGR
jgi:NitT/TauT family transport system ATP-binding protein